MAKWNESNRRWEAGRNPVERHGARAMHASLRRRALSRRRSRRRWCPTAKTCRCHRANSRSASKRALRSSAEGASRQLGLSRRGFLASVGGMAASFVAMNEVFGPYFKVDPLEMLVPEAYAAAAAPKRSLCVRRSAAPGAREPRQRVARTARARAGSDRRVAVEPLQQRQQAG